VIGSDLFPHFRVAFAKSFQNTGWPAAHLREAEAKTVLVHKSEELVEKYSVSDLISPDEFAQYLFDDFLDKSVLQKHKVQFAGDYFTFNGIKYRQYMVQIESADPLSNEANRIGNRFFPDVFDGYRVAFAGVKEQPLPQNAIDGKPWSSLVVPVNTVVEIKEKASGLISAIQQADLDDRVRENALAHARAVIDLLDAPDPPWRLIVDLLNNRYLCAILNSMAILQLIMGSFA